MKIILKTNGEIVSDKGDNVTHLVKSTLASTKRKPLTPSDPFITWQQIDEVTEWTSTSNKLFYYDNTWSSATTTFTNTPIYSSWVNVATS